MYGKTIRRQFKRTMTHSSACISYLYIFVAVCCSVMQCVAVCERPTRAPAFCACLFRMVICQRKCCNTLQHSVARCNALQRTATHCNTLQHDATHFEIAVLTPVLNSMMRSNTLQHTADAAARCSTLCSSSTDASVEFDDEEHHTAPHCSHIASHCGTLQHTS